MLAEEEELAAVRPDLDGEQIMAILGMKPGREVGEAYRFLLELRLDEGPLGPEEATAGSRPGGPPADRRSLRSRLSPPTLSHRGRVRYVP